jgi:hypothetical protein
MLHPDRKARRRGARAARRRRRRPPRGAAPRALGARAVGGTVARRRRRRRHPCCRVPRHDPRRWVGGAGAGRLGVLPFAVSGKADDPTAVLSIAVPPPNSPRPPPSAAPRPGARPPADGRHRPAGGRRPGGEDRPPPLPGAALARAPLGALGCMSTRRQGAQAASSAPPRLPRCRTPSPCQVLDEAHHCHGNGAYAQIMVRLGDRGGGAGRQAKAVAPRGQARAAASIPVQGPSLLRQPPCSTLQHPPPPPGRLLRDRGARGQVARRARSGAHVGVPTPPCAPAGLGTAPNHWQPSPCPARPRVLGLTASPEGMLAMRRRGRPPAPGLQHNLDADVATVPEGPLRCVMGSCLPRGPPLARCPRTLLFDLGAPASEL